MAPALKRLCSSSSRCARWSVALGREAMCPDAVLSQPGHNFPAGAGPFNLVRNITAARQVSIAEMVQMLGGRCRCGSCVCSASAVRRCADVHVLCSLLRAVGAGRHSSHTGGPGALGAVALSLLKYLPSGFLGRQVASGVVERAGHLTRGCCILIAGDLTKDSRRAQARKGVPPGYPSA